MKYVLLAKRKKIDGSKRKYPKVLQLPITYNCNSKCVMCNIWQMDYSNEFTIQEFDKFMQDSIFKEVEHVGINGGEPTLIKGLEDYAEKILHLPKLKSLNIITHGFNKKQLFGILEKIYAKCKIRKIHFHVAISLDGYGEIHNKVRGLKVFPIVEKNILEIISSKEKYCDSFDVGCTVIKQNVEHLVELDVFSKRNNIPIKYRMGIENKRIESDKLTGQYNLMRDPSVQSAIEFFYSRFHLAQNFIEKFKYFAIFHSISAVGKRKRLIGCAWKDEGLTMDSRGDIYYCAVESDKIGGLRQDKGEKIFFSDRNIDYRKSIVENKCDSCIHDYHGKPERTNVLFFIKYLLKDKLYWLSYRFNIDLFS